MATLRRADPQDAAALTALRALMHASMGDATTPQWEQLCRDAFARQLAAGDLVAFVVEDDGRVVSGGAGWLEEHLPSPYALDGRRGHIASMSTEPAARRRGHARAVFGALMGWFGEQGVTRVDLRATPDGHALYESFGFRPLGGATLAWVAPGTRVGMQAPGRST